MNIFKRTLWIVCILVMNSHIAYASALFTDLWMTKDQQAQKALSHGDVKTATQLFHDPLWQGVSYYRMQNYQKAAQDFAKSNSALAQFNLGNSLAQLGQYPQALQAYNQALKIQPKFADAKFNKALVEKLLQKQLQNSSQSSSLNSDKNKNPQQSAQDSQENSQNTQTKNSSSTSNLNKNLQNQDSKNPPPINSSPNIDNSQKNQKDSNPSKASPSPTRPIQNNSKEKQKNNNTSDNTNTVNSQELLQQWLRSVPDDPGGLLQNKFLRDHLRQTFANSGNTPQ